MRKKIKKTAEKIKTMELNSFLFMAMSLIVLINIAIILQSTVAVTKKVKAAEEAARPANVSLTIIKDSSCADCADITPLINAIKNTNIKITEEKSIESSSEEGKKITQEMGFKRIPTFVIKGELNKNEDVKKILGQVGEINGDTFKLNYKFTPYIDAALGSVKGKVDLTFITDASCAECYDVTEFTKVLPGGAGVVKYGLSKLDKKDKAAQDLINKYKIGALPSFVLTGETSEYPGLAGIWLQIGAIEKDGTYVLKDITKLNPKLAYRDLKTGKIINSVPAATPPFATPIPADTTKK